MKDLKNFILSNSSTIFVAYFVTSVFVIGILIAQISSHECRKTTTQINEETRTKLEEVERKHKEKIEQIIQTNDPDDIDSLLRELYGFDSN